MHLALFLGKREGPGCTIFQPTSSIVSNLKHVKIYYRIAGFKMWNIKSRQLLEVWIAFAASKPAQELVFA